MKKILIVEDEVIIGLHLKRTLEGMEYAALEPVDTLSDALELARRAHPDIALVDIGLHGSEEGIEIAARFRSEMDIPVIFLTAYTDELVAQRARQAEPFGYISKPFDARSLKATLEMALQRHQMERQLKASEERYHYLFEHMAHGIVYQDAVGKVTSANPAAQRILGLTLDQMLGRSSLDPRWHTIRPDGRPYPGEEHPAMLALRTGRPVKGVIMGLRQEDTGNTRWIQITSTPQFLPGAETPCEVFTTFEDVTELRASQEMTQTLANFSPDNIFVLDAGGTIEYVNRLMPEISPPDIIGKRLWDFELPVELNYARQVVEKALSGELADFSYTFDGRWFQLRFVPISQGGGPLRLVIFHTDVTARKTAERNLRLSDSTFQSLLEHLPVIVSRFDRQHRHLYINAAVEMDVPFAREDFLGKTNAELNMPVERACLWDAAIEAAFVSGEKQIIRFDTAEYGSERAFEAIFVPERDENGTIQTVLSVNIDRTAQSRPV